MSRESHLYHTFTDFSISRIVPVRYGVALSLVSGALCLSLLLHPFLSNAFLFFFLAAVMAAAWFGRTGPGLFSVAISTMLIDYYFIRPYHALEGTDRLSLSPKLRFPWSLMVNVFPITSYFTISPRLNALRRSFSGHKSNWRIFPG